MTQHTLFSWFALGLSSFACLAGGPAAALPGQSVPAAEAWIQGNPTLRPTAEERLVVNRVDTPAQRFSFQASVFPVSGVATTGTSSLIRTESFSLFDLINAVHQVRLEESLRAIYGAEIYTDYRRAQTLHSYPAEASLPSETALLLQGEVRQGERYAYWLELASDQSGNVYSGKMIVFLPEDLPGLLERLRLPSTL